MGVRAAVSASPFVAIGFGASPRAPYATDPARSRGRLFAEPDSPTRTPFQRDRDRIVHSTAFRRLKHKTQVFIYHEGDHYRTRLTHTIEVAQIARALARALRLDEDLAEALALSHDLGHTPFGHAGERAMNAVMAPFGGFDHNAQSLRIVTRLERRYAEFDGLNLSWETLEGLVKHNGPMTAGDDIPGAITEFDAEFPLELDTYASLEAQCAAIADDIAYDAHDIDDGLRARLFAVDELDDVPLAGDILKTVRERYPTIETNRLIAEITRRLITRMVEDVILTATSALDAARPADAREARLAGRALVGFSPAFAEADRAIKAFLFRRVYRSAPVNRVMGQAEAVVADLMRFYLDHPDALPADWIRNIDPADRIRLARKACDYVAGMTDRYCLQDHDRRFPGRLAASAVKFDDGPELG